MTAQILVHPEVMVVKKPDNWSEMNDEEKYRYLDTQICLSQPSVNTWEEIVVEEKID